MLEKAVSKPAIEENNNEKFQVNTAVHAWEKTEIYKLRYQVYVEEMAKPVTTQQEKHQLIDNLDERSLLFYVQAGKEIIATARLTIGSIDDYPKSLVKIFQMDKLQSAFGDPHLQYALATKLAIKKEYRNSTALYQLSSEFYSVLAKQNIPFWFGGCNPYLIPLYERMGFRRFAANFWDKGYGMLVPIVILVDDSDHFHAVRSPLYRQARKRKSDPETSKRFTEIFPETQRILNSRLTTDQTLWSVISEKLCQSPTTLSVFQGLSPNDLLALFESGAIFSCVTEDCLIEEHIAYHDLYLVLSGKLISRSTNKEHILQPGDWFGEFIPQITRFQATSIVALESSDLLVIPQQALERYRHFHPQAAMVITENLKNQLQPHNLISKGAYSHE